MFKMNFHGVNILCIFVSVLSSKKTFLVEVEDKAEDINTEIVAARTNKSSPGGGGDYQLSVGSRGGFVGHHDCGGIALVSSVGEHNLISCTLM